MKEPRKELVVCRRIFDVFQKIENHSYIKIWVLDFLIITIQYQNWLSELLITMILNFDTQIDTQQ
jgi:hypothetical protein